MMGFDDHYDIFGGNFKEVVKTPNKFDSKL
jgi:hypothetical protein